MYDIFVQMNEVTDQLAVPTSPQSGAASAGGIVQLSDPLTLPCGVTLPNRIAKSAMSETLGDRHCSPTPELVRLYKRWSRGGVGLLITGNVMVDRRSLGEPKNVALEDDRDSALFAEWASAAKSGGATAIVQLNHPGRQTLPGLSPDGRAVGPSAVRAAVPGMRFPMPRELSEAEIEDLIERFATAAALSVAAGFDGAQVHAAHGYLHSQFLSPAANIRTDGWGGDPERRRRFLIETLRAMREAIGPKAMLSVKLNSADFQRGGFDNEEALDVIRALSAESIDLLEISGGTYANAAMVGKGGSKKRPRASTAAREAYFMEFAERARAEVSLPLMVTGGFRTSAAMRAALAAGIDVIGMGRPLALEPDLPRALIASPAAASKLKPVSTGLKMLDGAAELIWAGYQLHQMAKGREPNPRLGVRRIVAKSLMHQGQGILRQRRGG